MQSDLRFIRCFAEFLEPTEISQLKNGLLYLRRVDDGKECYDVKYIGMSRGDRFGMNGRLRAHRRSKRKYDGRTHFSIFEVWDNVTKEEIEELEGFARHLTGAFRLPAR